MGAPQPVIGIPENVLVDHNAMFPGTERAYVNQDYLTCLARAGALPVMLPIAAGAEAIQAQLALVDGLLFSGGTDLGPLAYGEEPARELEDVFPDIDRHQLELARAAAGRDLPMLGICRGLQVLNVAFGGTLHQDLGRLPGAGVQHVQKGQRHAPSHTVDLVPGTCLAGLFGSSAIGTNSFHHQAVKDLAPGFTLSARARDGVIEGLERIGPGFILAVQWHPEGMAAHHPEMLSVFEALVRACAGRP